MAAKVETSRGLSEEDVEILTGENLFMLMESLGPDVPPISFAETPNLVEIVDQLPEPTLVPTPTSLKHLPTIKLEQPSKDISREDCAVARGLDADAVGVTPENSSAGSVSSCRPPKRRKKELTDHERKKRNAREQARSNRVSEKFEELRTILMEAGVIVPKGTKGSVLSMVIEYIRRLKQNTTKVET